MPLAPPRHRFGIKGGDVVLLEDRGNELVLKPEPSSKCKRIVDAADRR